MASSPRLRNALAAAVVVAMSTVAISTATEPAPLRPAIEPSSVSDVVTGHLFTALAEDTPADDVTLAFITSDEDIIQVDPADVTGITSGSEVTATLGDTDATGVTDVLDVAVTKPADTLAAEEAASSPQTTFVAVVTPKGVTPDPSLTTSVATSLVTQASSFWSAQSDGAVTFTVAATAAPYTSNYTCAQPSEMWGEARTKFPGFTEAPGQHLLMFLPLNAYEHSTCSYGLGTVGASVTTGGYLYVSDVSVSATAHELGHNMSLQHAQAFPDNVGETPSTANRVAYGNPYDIMGSSFSETGQNASNTVGNLTPVHQARLGMISSAQVGVVSTAGVSTHTIAATDHSAPANETSPRLLTVTDPRNNLKYYLEYRPKVGRDNNAPWVTTPGLLIQRDSTTTANETVLVDTAPNTGTNSTDQALTSGRTWTSVGGGVKVTLVSGDATQASLSVEVLPSPSAPALTVSADLTYLTSGAVSAVLNAPGATGTVEFSTSTAGGSWVSIGTSPVTNGTASLPWTPQPTPGSSNKIIKVKADYTPSTSAFQAASATADVAVKARPTTTTATVTGSSVRVSVTATGGTVDGNVSVSATNSTTGSTVTRNGVLSNGATVVDLTGIGDGAWQAVASYVGDQPLYGYTVSATSAAAPVAVEVSSDPRTPSTLTASATPTSLEVGAQGSVAVSVAAAGATPTGTVTVKNGATLLGTGSLSGGSANIAITPTSVGTATLTVDYSGDSNVRPSTGTLTVTVTKKAVSITASGPAQITAGETAAIKVTTTSGGGATPIRGTVTVTPGQGAAGKSRTVATSGVVTVNTPTQTAAGTATFTVSIAATATTAPASTTFTVAVVKAAPSVHLIAPDRVTANQAFPVTIVASAPGLKPTGNYTISTSGQQLVHGTLINGRATINVTVPASGRTTLTLTYDGDTGTQSATSTRVTMATRSVASMSAWVATTGKAGASVPISVTVQAPNGTPSGVVQVREKGVVVATVTLVDGRGSTRIKLPAAGKHSWLLTYSGDVSTKSTALLRSMTVS